MGDGHGRRAARKNIDVILADNFDAVISNAAGCGSTLKEYGDLLEGLEDLQAAGVHYVLLTIAGGRGQMRRFARDIMPAFARSAAAADAAE